MPDYFMYSKYLGIPYKNKGRNIKGLDCYGLLYLFYKVELDILIPSFDDKYNTSIDKPSIDKAIKSFSSDWIEVNKPRKHDGVVFTIGGYDTHIGIMIDQEHFMHILENTEVTIESINSLVWNRRNKTFRRLKT